MSKERAQKQKEDTLRKILDEAWKIAVEEGVDAISIRKIANALSFAPNNLYNYFENKNELMKLLKQDSYQWAFDIMQTVSYEGDSMCAMFKQVSEKLLAGALDEPEKYVVMTSDAFMDDQSPMDKTIADMVAEKIKQGIASGELADTDPVKTAMNLRMTQIAFVRMVSSNKAISRERAFEMHDNLMDILFDGIRKKDTK